MRRILTLILLFVGQHLIAQTIVTEAPSMTSSTYTLSAADFQIESRLEYNKRGQNNLYSLPINLFRVGLGKRFEFRTQNGVEYRTYDNVDFSSITFRQMSIGTKYGILGGDRKTTLAVILDVNIPEYKSKVYGANFIVAASHTIAEKHAISYNISYNPSTNNWEYDHHNFNASLMYSTMLSERIGVYGEAFWNFYDSAVNGNYTSYTNFDVGFIYLIRDHIQLDYSFGLGASSPMVYHALGFNILFSKNK